MPMLKQRRNTKVSSGFERMPTFQLSHLLHAARRRNLTQRNFLFSDLLFSFFSFSFFFFFPFFGSVFFSFLLFICLDLSVNEVLKYRVFGAIRYFTFIFGHLFRLLIIFARFNEIIRLPKMGGTFNTLQSIYE